MPASFAIVQGFMWVNRDFLKSCFYIYGWLLFPAFILFEILILGVDVPVADDWAFVSMIEKMYAGTLTWKDLFVPHNEHILAIPRLFILANARFAHWNQIYMMFCSWLLSFIGFLFLKQNYFSFNKTSSAYKQIIFFFISALYFSPMQNDNWLWASQVQIHLAVLFAVTTFYILTSKNKEWGLIISLSFSVLGILSFGNGFVVAFIASIYYFTFERSVWKGIFLLLWGFLSILFVSMIMKNHTSFPGLKEIISVPFFMASLLGNCIVHINYIIGILAFVVAIAYFVLVERKKVNLINMKDYIQKQPFFFMIGLYGLMSGLIIAMGRIEMGLQMSHSGRYITISKFFVLGVLGFIAYEDIKPKKYFVALIIILISYAYIRDFGLSYSAKESKKKSVIEFENVQLFQEFSYKENATTYKDIHFIFENKLSCFYSIKKPNKLPVNKKL